MKKLVLFDIDGTLINPGGAGRRSLGGCPTIHDYKKIVPLKIEVG
jgi:phosphoglycolate phosphatase-like HAD superfamily hydrolase